MFKHRNMLLNIQF